MRSTNDTWASWTLQLVCYYNCVGKTLRRTPHFLHFSFRGWLNSGDREYNSNSVILIMEFLNPSRSSRTEQVALSCIRPHYGIMHLFIILVLINDEPWNDKIVFLPFNGAPPHARFNFEEQYFLFIPPTRPLNYYKLCSHIQQMYVSFKTI